MKGAYGPLSPLEKNMKYTPTYFDFDKLEHWHENMEVFLTVVAVYSVIFVSAWVYNRLSR